MVSYAVAEVMQTADLSIDCCPARPCRESMVEHRHPKRLLVRAGREVPPKAKRQLGHDLAGSRMASTRLVDGRGDKVPRLGVDVRAVRTASTVLLRAHYRREHAVVVIQQPVSWSRPMVRGCSVIGVSEPDLDMGQVALERGADLGVPFVQRERAPAVTTRFGEVPGEPRAAEPGIDPWALSGRNYRCGTQGLPSQRRNGTLRDGKPRWTAGICHVAGAALFPGTGDGDGLDALGLTAPLPASLTIQPGPRAGWAVAAARTGARVCSGTRAFSP
jgi:hypothetical protein